MKSNQKEEKKPIGATQNFELTRSLEAKNKEKKKSKKMLILTLGTITVIAGGSIGLVYTIDKANKSEI